MEDYQKYDEGDEEFKGYYGNAQREFASNDYFQRPLIQFTSTKQITDECERILKEEFGAG